MGKIKLVTTATRPRTKAPPRIRRYRRAFVAKRNLTSLGNNISRNISVFPESYNFKGRYVTNTGLSTNTGGTTAQSRFGDQLQFHPNGIYRPQFGITNHAMLGWTELKALYRKYKVRGVKIKVTFNNPTADGLVAAIWIQAPDALNSITSKTVPQLAEKQDVFFKYLNNTGSQVAQFTRYIPMHKLCNISKLQLMANVEDYSANMTANPIKYPTIKIALAATELGTTERLCNVNVEMTYYGTAYERVMMSMSDPSA